MPQPNSPIPLYTAGGVAVPITRTGTGTDADPFVYTNALAAATTYYAEMGSELTTRTAWQWVYSAAIAVTSITVASTCMPRECLTPWNTVNGWVVDATMAGTAIVAGSVGSQIMLVEGNTPLRQRAVIVVGATGGSFVGFHVAKAVG